MRGTVNGDGDVAATNIQEDRNQSAGSDPKSASKGRACVPDFLAFWQATKGEKRNRRHARESLSRYVVYVKSCVDCL